MTEFIFDENKIKKELITYCNKVNELYKAGNGASVSLNTFITEFKPKIAYKLITSDLGVA